MRTSFFISLTFLSLTGLCQDKELTDEEYATLCKRMAEHDFTIVTMDDVVLEGALLFANDSVLALWMDQDSIIDFDRLSEETVHIVYYYNIHHVRQGTSYNKKANIFLL